MHNRLSQSRVSPIQFLECTPTTHKGAARFTKLHQSSPTFTNLGPSFMHRRFGAHSVFSGPKQPNREMTMNTSTSANPLHGFIATTIFAALASSFSAVSAADPTSAGITVKYADINLASPSGALVLYERIQAAAKSACNYFWFKTDAAEAQCLQNTIASAVTRVNRPALSAVYNAKFKISAPSPLVSQSR
jgi:UrcA family protein